MERAELQTCSFEDLASRIDLPLLSPELSEDDVIAGCRFARENGLASVVVRPSDIEIAVRCIGGALPVGSVLDYPYGYATTAAKQYAARDLLRRGANAIETPINYGKFLSRQFHYLEMELHQIAQACGETGARLTVSIDAPRLTEELIMLSCRILRRAGVSTLSTTTLESAPLIQAHAREKLQIKIGGGVQDLETALAAYRLGCVRMEVTGVVPALASWKAEMADRG
jgi:deoxyribose-phosphate aldolase